MIITVDQQVTLSVAFTDKAGNPAFVDGDPVWTSTDAAVEIVATDSPFVVIARSTGVGVAQVRVEADADLGEGVKPVTALADVEVVAGEAIAAVIAAGTPEDKPVPVVEEPAPADPAPVDPAPVDPAPVDPAPVDPAPVDPPADPAV